MAPPKKQTPHPEPDPETPENPKPQPRIMEIKPFTPSDAALIDLIAMECYEAHKEYKRETDKEINRFPHYYRLPDEVIDRFRRDALQMMGKYSIQLNGQLARAAQQDQQEKPN